MVNFSVLMSVYAKEKAEFLMQSLESVLSQTLPADEIILVEDGPLTEELRNVVDNYSENYSSLRIVRLPENRGLGPALNEGLKHCSHELVARMDSDDICFPNRFERQIEFMTENPDIDISSAWIEEFEGSPDNVKSIKKVPCSHNEISKYLKLRSPLNHPAVIFRKSAVLKAGSYQHFPLFEDWFLWARMFKSGARFANIPDPLLHFRTSPDMYKRRGGLKYALDNIRFQRELHRLGLISTFKAVQSGFIRCVVYLMPNHIRAIIFKKLLR